MPLVNAKCTNCGGTLQVDNAKEAAVCPFCGSAFIVEKAVQNFNITNNIITNNNVQADVVNIYNVKRDDFLIEGGILKKYKGADTEVVIPEGVVEIGERSFADMKYITKVTFPKSLRTIQKYAFKNCLSLRSVEIKDNVTIRSFAFASCAALDSIYLGNDTVIEDVAFDAGNGLSIKSMFIGSVNYDRAIFGLRWRDSEMITIDLLEIRDNAAVTTTRYRPRFKNPDRRYNDFLLETAHVKNLKIGNNVQLSTSLFCHCKIENLSVGNNLQCNGLPLGVNIYKKNSPAWLQTAVFADAADLKRNAAQRGKKLGVYNCSVQKNVLFFFKGPKNQATKFILKKGSLQTCVCCGKDKLVQKEGKTICKKCGATYIFENPNS